MVKGTGKILSVCLMLLVVTAGITRAAVYTYTDEAAYLTALTDSFGESFEDDAVWGDVRSPATASSVTSQGITWTSNHPATNNITTGNGAAVTGEWGIYDPLHGVATGTALECDVDNPPIKCLYHDGISGTWVADGSALYGIGGWFSGTFGANIEFFLDQDQVGLGKLGFPAQQPQFFGVIETNGFSKFEVRETDGKVGDNKFIFADDFTFARAISIPCVPTGFPDDNCDGVDDDCSGVADDGYEPDTGCGVGICLTNNTPSSCVGGVETLCKPGIPIPENTDQVCTDSLDNDCDGLVDAADPSCSGERELKFPWTMYLPAILGAGLNKGK